MNKTLLINGQEVAVSHVSFDDGKVSFTIGGKQYSFRGKVVGGQVTLSRDGDHENLTGVVVPSKNGQMVILPGIEAMITQPSLTRKKSGGAKQGGLSAPMPGMVQKVLVKAGDKVEKGDTLVVMEAMKLQLPITAPHNGIVDKVLCKAGEMVSEGVELVSLKQEKDGK